MSSSLRIGNEGNDDSLEDSLDDSLVGVFAGHSSGRFNPTLDQQLKPANSWIQVVFGLAVMLIAAASIYDAFLVYKYREGIIEQNPICEWLIRQDPDSVSLFLIAKGAGTAGVVTILIGLFAFWRRAGVTAALALVTFQAGLMYYLHTSEISRPVVASATVADSLRLRSEIQPIEKSRQRTQREKRARSVSGSNGELRRKKRQFKQGKVRVQGEHSQHGHPKKKRAEKIGDQSLDRIEIA